MWDGYDPDATIEVEPEPSAEELADAAAKVHPPQPRRQLMTTIHLLGVILWGVAHFAGLYVMAGSPISAGVLVYVVVNLCVFGHYFVLLVRERGRQ